MKIRPISQLLQATVVGLAIPGPWSAGLASKDVQSLAERSAPAQPGQHEKHSS